MLPVVAVVAVSITGIASVAGHLHSGRVLFTASSDRVHTLGRNKRRELLGASPVSVGVIWGDSPAFVLESARGSNSRWRRV
jgi:hypothetical protein